VGGGGYKKRCMKMEKVRHVETIPGMGEGEIKENDGRGELTMIYCKKFCKCHSVPQVEQL
jgi:hypothetical protein